MSRDARHILRSLLAAIEDPAGAPPSVGGDAVADAEGLLAVARRHRLTPMLSSSGVALPPAVAAAARHDRVTTTARNLLFAGAAAECLRAISAGGTPVVVLKGLAYERTLYAEAGVRPTADVDLLVPSRARDAAFRALDELGYEPRVSAPSFDEPDYHESAWTRAGIEVDLHQAFAPLVRGAIDYDEVWAAVQPLELAGVAANALGPAHAAVFHALHMAIDHFDVPGMYLLDLARLLPTREAAAAAEAVARRWRCHRALDTALALAAAFLPGWGGLHRDRPTSARAHAVIDDFGLLERLSRPRQLVRKVAHFDRPIDVTRYAVVQGRRKLRELVESRRGRSARERLGLATRR